MENIDEIVKNFPKKDPFKVPDGYFENLTTEVLEKSQRNLQSSRKYIAWKYPLQLAASFAILIVFTFAIFSIFNKTETQPVLVENVEDSIPEDEFVDESTIMAFYEDSTWQNTETELTHDEIAEYLVDENVSFELIAEYY